MPEKQASEGQKEAPDPPSHPIRLPGFLTEDEVGLGDVIKHATASVGLKPCGGCTRRAAALNRWLVFSGRRSP